MSETPKAVFISYASKDVVAALRIAVALRAAGIEVWLDQNELGGGDAWDRKIRAQIGACALFVPVISAETQARQEGYFRLEWHLAEQRSLLIAKGRPFVVPVSIDATTERDALVPEAFTAVQWTKLPAGETTPAFVVRVQKLLGEEPMETGRPRPVACASDFAKASTDKEGVASPVQPVGRALRARLGLAAAGLAALVAVVAGVVLTRQDDPAARRSAPPTSDNSAPSPNSHLPSSSGQPAADQKSVAVLAFANLSDDKGNEYFSDGISEELLNVLAKIPGLKVSARTSAFFFKARTRQSRKLPGSSASPMSSRAACARRARSSASPHGCSTRQTASRCGRTIFGRS